MIQRIGIHLPMQETKVRSLVQEDSSCFRATKAHAPHLLSPHDATTEAPAPGACACNKRSHINEKPWTSTKSNLCLPQLEKACEQQWRPSITEKKKKKQQNYRFANVKKKIKTKNSSEIWIDYVNCFHCIFTMSSLSFAKQCLFP